MHSSTIHQSVTAQSQNNHTNVTEPSKNIINNTGSCNNKEQGTSSKLEFTQLEAL